MAQLTSNSGSYGYIDKALTFKVEGLHCAQCIKKVKNLESETADWGAIDVDLGRQTLSVKPRANFNSNSFMDAVAKLGFKVRSIQISDKFKAEQKKENRLFLARLGVAGAFAGNIMLIAFALYSGADSSEWALPLRWLSFALFLPVMFFSAWPFLINGFKSLWQLRASIDLPLAVALVGGSGLSLYNLLIGASHIYFDSLSILVFLILSTRYLVYRIQVNHLEPVSVQDILGQTEKYFVQNKNKSVSYDELEYGDLILLNSGDSVPADGVLESKFTEMDTSLLTGESLPYVVKQFSEVFSGSKVLTDGVLIRLTKDFSESRAKKLMRNINESVSKRTPLTSFTDRAAQALTIIVVLIGASFFAYYTTVDTSQAVNRTLALLVIACPCALAIATPLSLSLGIKKAFKKGIIVKKPDAIERLQNCKTIVFDKTGTLTKNSVEVINWSHEPTEQQSVILYNLEKNSSHPYARAIIRSLNKSYLKDNDVKNFIETPGQGVTGEIFSEWYSVRRLEEHKENFQAGLFKNEELLLAMEFSSEPYEDSLTEIKKLHRMGYKTYMLTGDKDWVSQRMAAELLIDPNNVLTQMAPEQKAEFVEGIANGENVIYVGDGLNDSLAMSKASVSFSANASVDASYKTSDIHLLNNGISGVIKLLDISRKTISTIKTNLWISFLYNITFGALALSGFINPLIAAFLMPISSVTVIGHSLIRLKSSEKNLEAQ